MYPPKWGWGKNCRDNICRERAKGFSHWLGEGEGVHYVCVCVCVCVGRDGSRHFVNNMQTIWQDKQLNDAKMFSFFLSLKFYRYCYAFHIAYMHSNKHNYDEFPNVKFALKKRFQILLFWWRPDIHIQIQWYNTWTQLYFGNFLEGRQNGIMLLFPLSTPFIQGWIRFPKISNRREYVKFSIKMGWFSKEVQEQNLKRGYVKEKGADPSAHNGR